MPGDIDITIVEKLSDGDVEQIATLLSPAHGDNVLRFVPEPAEIADR